MQDLAAELNLPATAFVRPLEEQFELRWFTATQELALCGHGTLASAHVLWSEGHLPTTETARFDTRAGPLAAELRDGSIELDFPAEPPEPAEPPDHLLEAFGVTPRSVARNRLDYLLELESEEAVRRVQPDLALLRVVSTRGVIVTARATTAGFDIVSRFFAPSVGIDEDSVTGSAHCCLGPYWQDRLGRADLVAYQASARGGVVRVGVRGDRVRLRGQAVTILRATLA
jgi:PhzF family phenazine biosynthesis protein